MAPWTDELPVVGLHRLAERLVAAGFPAEALHGDVRLWRTDSGRKLHAVPRQCARRSDIKPRNPVTVDFFAGYEDFCECVEEIPEGPVAHYVSTARLSLETEHLLEETSSGVTTLTQLRQLRVAARRFEELQPFPEVIERRCTSVRGMLVSQLASEPVRELTEREQALRVERIARELYCEERNASYKPKFIPPYDRDAVALYEGAHYYCTPERVLGEAYGAWLDALEHQNPPERARDAAIRAGISTAGGAPSALAQVPSDLRYRGSDFASPAQWATAEWNAAVADDLAAMVARWEQGVARLLAEGHGRHTVTVRTSAHQLPEDVSDLLEAFGARTCEAHVTTQVACVPEIAISWLAARAVSRSGYPRFEYNDLGALPEGYDPAYLEVAEQLWDDGSSLYDAVELALLSTSATAAPEAVR